MASAARKNLRKSIDLLTQFDQTKYDKIQSREERVDLYEDQLGSYLVKLSAQELSADETRRSAMLLQSLTNLERISDHAMNIAELAEEMKNRRAEFSEEAQVGLNVCVEAVLEIIDLAYAALAENDLAAAARVELLEDTIDLMTERLKARHVNRLQSGQCTLSLGFVFNDCINNFERVADHCSNIALIVLENQKVMDMATHSYEETMKEQLTADFQSCVQEYKEKYLDRLMQPEEAPEETMGGQTSLFSLAEG
jgi:phosphate:Na+ symporter